MAPSKTINQKPVIQDCDGPLYRPFICGESSGRSESNRHDLAMDAMDLQGAWVMTLAGHGYYEDGQHRHRLDAGSVLALHRPARGVLIDPGEKKAWRSIWVHVVGHPALELFDFIVNRFGIIQHLSVDATVVKKARALVRMTRSGQPYGPHLWSLRTYDFLNTWWACVEEEAPPTQQVLRSKHYDSRVLSYHPGSVKLFAHRMGYSRSYLSRKLKKQWRESPGVVLRRARLDDAAQLLRTTDLMVKDVADKVGYQSTTAFIRAFKTEFGMPPLVYRHEHR